MKVGRCKGMKDLSPAEMMNACFPQGRDRGDLLAELVRLVTNEDEATVRMLLGQNWGRSVCPEVP